ncbi:MAG: hypothetical protein IJU08_08890 [Bacteroidales bacterium]|nr:hypothetical protein [Bacteroidales bacterium]
MKRIFAFLLLAGALLAAPACKKQKSPVAQENPKIETGDLLFVGIPMNYGDEGMAQAIADATSQGDSLNFIHAAILEVDEAGAVWVIDATIAHGVDRHPLDTLFADFTLHRGGRATFEVMRLTDNRNASTYVDQAKEFLGEEYDLYFMTFNGRHYCTELISDAYVNEDGYRWFEPEPMNFKNAEGEYPSYWVRLFAQLGEPIPQDEYGTNPQAMHASPGLVHVMYL